MTDDSKHYQEIVDFIRSIYGDGFIPLHRPVFEGNERQYLVDCIDSNFVSSVGAEIVDFEQFMADFTGTSYAVATVNGTAALHVALELAGVCRGDEVITQALTFIATCNALSYAGADPVFIDVDRDTMGMSPAALRSFLSEHAEIRDGVTYNRRTGRRLAACSPMHTFGIPCRIEEIVGICDDYGIPVVEDAAESLGSYVGDRHTGTFGRLATLSFNGNKVITTGGGGMIITDDEILAKRAKHLTTTAKVPHAYEFVHDEIGYNYRMPNLNAVLGCAQMEKLAGILEIKAEIASSYAEFFGNLDIDFVTAPQGTTSNYWLNAIVFPSKSERDRFLEFTNEQGVMTRPIWQLMSEQKMFLGSQNDGLDNSKWLEQRVVNIPSSVPDNCFEKLRQT
jgi:perosamine synthetase